MFASANREDAAEADGDKPRGKQSCWVALGKISCSEVAESDSFIIIFLFAFAFQMLNKVSGVVRNLYPSPPGASLETPSRPRPVQWRWLGWGGRLGVVSALSYLGV